jgi:3-oxoacyl-[acyl-carrier protein] reductase
VKRRVFITGTTRGLGKALAEYYLAGGDIVMGCGRSSATIEHERYSHYVADVTDDRAVADLFARMRTDHDRLDVLINNAGVASMNAFALTPPASMRKVIDTNLLGPMILTHGGLRLLRRSEAGRIVNISTIAVPLRLEGEAVYAASKSAVEVFTRILAREVGPFRITCNAVGPSIIPTRLTEGVPADKISRLLNLQAVRRQASPADVCHVIDFFLRPESDLITGQVVYLGGFA